MVDPRREAVRRMAEDLDREAVVTERDKALAPRFWATYGTPLLRRLLNAVREPRG